jgi:hypothetical protein
VLVSTGAGSTGWLSSMFNMAAGLTGGGSSKSASKAAKAPRKQFDWESPELFFVVREPFASRQSQCAIVCGPIAPGQALHLESSMPLGGVIFSDGIEAHYLGFNSGVTAEVRAAEERAHLVIA